MIRSTLGPSGELEVSRTPDLSPALVDPPQLGNALPNLAINARDAMPNGRRVKIEASTLRLDENKAAEFELTPGEYIALCVTDTGTGMAPEVLARAFDPFSTTKPMHEVGDGLALTNAGQNQCRSRLIFCLE